MGRLSGRYTHTVKMRNLPYEGFGIGWMEGGERTRK
jgi:hypothetical protein